MSGAITSKWLAPSSADHVPPHASAMLRAWRVYSTPSVPPTQACRGLPGDGSNSGDRRRFDDPGFFEGGFGRLLSFNLGLFFLEVAGALDIYAPPGQFHSQAHILAFFAYGQ